MSWPTIIIAGAGCALIISTVIGMLVGRWLKRLSIEQIREVGLPSQNTVDRRAKRTPLAG